ncbi:hypothetical protein B0H12DRAFT_1124254 [Mycena haematopus]|nr:hypothetical protein B0H12DRAFT_1124254 [Mycena haematopus]
MVLSFTRTSHTSLPHKDECLPLCRTPGTRTEQHKVECRDARHACPCCGGESSAWSVQSSHAEAASTGVHPKSSSPSSSTPSTHSLLTHHMYNSTLSLPVLKISKFTDPSAFGLSITSHAPIACVDWINSMIFSRDVTIYNALRTLSYGLLPLRINSKISGNGRKRGARISTLLEFSRERNLEQNAGLPFTFGQSISLTFGTKFTPYIPDFSTTYLAEPTHFLTSMGLHGSAWELREVTVAIKRVNFDPQI